MLNKLVVPFVLFGVMILANGCGGGSGNPASPTIPPVVTTPPTPTGPVTVQVATINGFGLDPYNLSHPYSGAGANLPVLSSSGRLDVQVTLSEKESRKILVSLSKREDFNTARLVKSQEADVVGTATVTMTFAGGEGDYIVISNRSSIPLYGDAVVFFTPDK